MRGVRLSQSRSDYLGIEVGRDRLRAGLALASLQHGAVKINLLDTPGYADFVGELRAGLRAADCALFVMAANDVVDAATKALWRECADVGMPNSRFREGAQGQNHVQPPLQHGGHGHDASHAHH